MAIPSPAKLPQTRQAAIDWYRVLTRATARARSMSEGPRLDRTDLFLPPDRHVPAQGHQLGLVFDRCREVQAQPLRRDRPLGPVVSLQELDQTFWPQRDGNPERSRDHHRDFQRHEQGSKAVLRQIKTELEQNERASRRTTPTSSGKIPRSRPRIGPRKRGSWSNARATQRIDR